MRRLLRLPGAVLELGLALVLFAYSEWLVRRYSLPVAAQRMRVTMSAGEQRLPDAGTTTGTRGATAVPAGRLPRWAMRRVRGVERVGRWWPLGRSGPCLRSSLVVGRRLEPLRPVLCLGVRRDRAGLRAHAWVHVAGIDLDLDPGDWAPLPIGSEPTGRDPDRGSRGE